MGITSGIIGVLTLLRLIWKPVLLGGLVSLAVGLNGAMNVAHVLGTICLNGGFVAYAFAKTIVVGIIAAAHANPALQLVGG